MGFLVTFAEVLAAIGVVVLYVLDFNRSCLTSGKNEVLVGGADRLTAARDRRAPCWIVGEYAEGVFDGFPTVSFEDVTGNGGGMPADGLVTFEGESEGVVLCHPSATADRMHRLQRVSAGDALWVPKGWTVTH